MRMTEEVPKISNSKMTHVGIVKKIPRFCKSCEKKVTRAKRKQKYDSSKLHE